MALFPDKKKPVDIYKQGSPTELAQQKMNNSGVAVPARSFVDATRRFSGGALGGNALASGINRLSSDAARNTTAIGRDLATRANRDTRAANALTFGDGARIVQNSKNTNMSPERERIVLESAAAGVATPSDAVTQSLSKRTPRFKPPGINPTGPLSENVIPFQPRETATLENSTAARAMKENELNPGPQTTTEYGQGPNGTFTRRQVPIARRTLGPQPPQNGTMKVGNLDVTFDSSVDAGARKRFLENPVRPTAQINRFNANRDAGQGELAAMNAGRILGRSQPAETGPQLLTKENSGGMGWKARKELNQQILANYQADKNAKLGAETSMDSSRIAANTNLRTAQVSEKTALDRNNLDRYRAEKDAENNASQNEISRLNVTGQNAERGVNVEAKRMELENAKKIQGLQDKFYNAKDDKERAAAEKNLIAAGALKPTKPEVFFEPEYGPMGEVVGKKPYVLENGVVRPATPEGGTQSKAQAPQKAIEDLMKNPKLKEDFRRKYGYLPNGV